MKKKNLIIPLSLIVLCLAAIVFVTFFTTPFCVIRSISKNKSNKPYTDDDYYTFRQPGTDYLAVFNETHEKMETICKINPSANNYYYLSYILFNPANIDDPKYISICPDYNRRSVEYAGKIYELVSKQNANVGDTFIPMFIDERKSVICSAAANYANALYLTGDREKAKKIAEDYIYSLKNDMIRYARAFDVYGFFKTVAVKGDSEDVAWLVGLEKYICDYHEQHIDDIMDSKDYYYIDLSEWNVNENNLIDYDYRL